MRTIFVGDIHGCAEEFAEILEKVAFKCDRDRLLLTGDILSRGPDPIGVWETVQQTGAEMVLGNHDDRLLNQLRCERDGQSLEIDNPDQVRVLSLVTPVMDGFLPWLEAVPLFISDADFLLVHAGINPAKGLNGTTRNEFLKIRTWPPVKGLDGPRWHDCYEPDNRILVFGHDAPGGLVEKRRSDGSLYLIGLDSGCVYGNRLSAYVFEENRIVQVTRRQ